MCNKNLIKAQSCNALVFNIYMSRDPIAEGFGGRKTKENRGELVPCHSQLRVKCIKNDVNHWSPGIGGRVNCSLYWERIWLVGDYQRRVVWVDIERHATLRVVWLLWCPRHHSDTVDHRTHRHAQRAA